MRVQAVVYSPVMAGARLRSLAAPTAFVILTVALALFGRISNWEALMLSLAVLAAFVPGTILRPAGWQRMSAEFLLLPAAAVLTIFRGDTLRMMLLPPLVGVAAWTAWWACRSLRNPGQQKKKSPIFSYIPSSGFGLSIAVLASVGGLETPTSAIINATGAALLASGMAFLGPIGVFTGAFVGALSPPIIAGFLIIPALLLIRYQRTLLESRRMTQLSVSFQSLLPICGAFGIFVLALSNWGLPPLALIFPQSSWISALGLAAIVCISLCFRPAASGAIAVLACLLLGPSISPIQEGGANIHLDSHNTETALRSGQGRAYGIEIRLDGGKSVQDGETVGWILLPKKRIPLKADRHFGGKSILLKTGANPKNPGALSATIILRPPARRSQDWRISRRWRFKVPRGVSPRVLRNPKIERHATLTILAEGPLTPTPPRDSDAEHWLWAAAGVLALLQLLSGTWTGAAGGIPWIPLTTGLIITRAAIEPLHLMGERYSVDLALASVLLAWIPAAWSWSRRRRFFLPAFLLLGSLAFATAHLTPPMWGDEPYHLALMESLVTEHSLNPAPYLQGGGATRDLILSTGHLFHSPVLAFLLLPGYIIAGRSGALILMALYGALALVILLRTFRKSIRLKARSEFFLFLILVLSYPLSCFTGQIWPAILGILCTAGALLLVTPDSATPGRAGSALVLAALSGAIKTRMALISFPVALTGFRYQRKSFRWWLGLVAAIVTSLGIGWVFLGHPFGAFRRLRDLFPTDPILAGRVLCGLLFDSAGGLLWTAPFWIIALLMLPRIWRIGKPAERGLILGAAATVFLLLPSGEWYGGGSPPARYLVPVLPLVAIALARLLEAADGRRRLLMLLIPPSFFAWWILTTRPHLSLNPGDGRWHFSSMLSRAFQADADSLFPSFLHFRSASIFVPIIVSCVILLLWWLFARDPACARHISRIHVAVWLILSMAFTTTLLVRSDTTVEAEAPQVQRHGGRAFPAAGVPQRWAHTVGWSLSAGDSIDFPLHLEGGDEILLVARIRGRGPGTGLGWRWDEGPVQSLAGPLKIPSGGLRISAPGDPGQHKLSISFNAHAGTSLLIDRIEVVGK